MKTIKVIFLSGILLGNFFSNAQEVIKSAGPVVLPAQTGQTKVVLNGQSLTVTSNSAVVLNDGFHAQSGSSVLIGITSQSIYPIPPFVNNTNPELNWVLSRKFNERGDTVNEDKKFYDLGGLSLQNQVKSFTTKHVLAGQAIYDRFGRPAIQTLTAPINSSGFYYKSDFARNNSGLPYNVNNFDAENKVNAPDAVDANQPGSLGWYYSNNNSWDAYVPATAYPYSRSDMFLDGTGEVARGAGVGEQLKMGMGREMYGSNFPVSQQLNHYLSVRARFFNDADMGNVSNVNLIGNAVESVIKDEQGNWGIKFLDKSGKSLMSALSGSSLIVNNTIDLTVYNEEFLVDGNVGEYSKGIVVKGSGKLKVYDNNVLIYHGAVTGYVPPVSVNSSHVFKYKSNRPFTVSYGLVTTSGYLAVCESCVSKVNTDAAQIGQDFHYFNLTKSGTLGISGGTITLKNLITNNVEVNYSSLPAGLYKAIALTGEPRITYSSGYTDISYNFYNQSGNLVGSIAPNGVQKLITEGITAYTGKEQIPFVNLFEYDKQGRLTSTKFADAGKTEHLYRKDGSLRFTQDAEQRKGGRFSYTNYDEIGRIIESGEYLSGSITFESAKQNFVLLENTSPDGGLTGGTKRDWSKIHYDLNDNSHGLAGYQQDFTEGGISWTENANAKTWYSYDEQGKTTWIIKELTGLGLKTIDYTYDFLGSITKVTYQKAFPSESFYHHYEYDKDQRLTNMQTSLDGVNKLQQVNYEYYLHGPLKRAALGEDLQGIDYTYTPQGWIKTINHPTKASDPGKDGTQNNFAADAFGMTLEYFNGDYTRASTGINSLATNTGKAWYNGNISGQSWKSLKPNSVVAGYGAAVNNPAMFTYEYDDKLQLNSNKYGVPNYGTNSFSESANVNKEHGLSYDANGNIQSLNRNAANGAQLSLSYQYQANTNKLQSVSGYASYTYDDLGQMTGQVRANGEGYYNTYDISGKITAIYSDAAKTQLKISYAYDEGGVRIRKTDHVQGVITYYVYDLNGNILAIHDNNGGVLRQKEIPLYASDRIGVYNRVNNNYQYELSDYLGNIRVVINRNKASNGQTDVISYSDYYPFGTALTLAGSDYRYGYQGKFSEKDNQTGWNAFDARMYDPMIGRWMSPDPKNQFHSPYLGMGNNPVYVIDKDGRWVHIAVGAVIGAGYAALEMGLKGELDLSKGKTWAKIGLGAGTGALTAAMPVSLFGMVGAGYIGMMSKFVDQGIDVYAAGKSLRDRANFNFNEMRGEGLLAAVSFGFGSQLTKVFRLASLTRQWSGTATSLSRLFYRNPSLSGYAAGNIVDFVGNTLKFVYYNNELVERFLEGITITAPKNIVPELQKAVETSNKKD